MLTEMVWAWFCDSVPHILLYFVLLPAPSVSLHDTAQSVPSGRQRLKVFIVLIW